MQLASCVIFACGIWWGWLIARSQPGEISVSSREHWRHGPNPEKYRRNPRIIRAVVMAVAGAFGGVATGFFASSMHFHLLYLICFEAVAFSAGVAWGLGLFGKT